MAIDGPELLADLRQLAERFDAFFVDQFGVLHDGNAPYPGAVEALLSLKAAGKTIVLVSNSSKRASLNEDRLLGLGFQPGTWDIFLSSGEVAWRKFAGQFGMSGWRRELGARCCHVGGTVSPLTTSTWNWCGWRKRQGRAAFGKQGQHQVDGVLPRLA
ncbi:HAD family hydrolase [Mesorhizobium sp. A623]